LDARSGKCSGSKKLAELFGGDDQEIGSSGRVEFQFQPDTKLCVSHIFVINGFTQYYLCELYCTGILAKWIHNMDVFVCIYQAAAAVLAPLSGHTC
jgi:hypothetical protein